MAFKPGQGGRPKGAKNKATKNKESRALTAVAMVAATSKPAGGILLPPTAPVQAIPGIEPKDLLLTSMRTAWECAHKRSAEADELDAAAALATDSETIEHLKERATQLRIEAGRHISFAKETAKDVAPYCHPKLANVDTKVAGGLVIQLKQYGP
jgi:hypothetical protein